MVYLFFTIIIETWAIRQPTPTDLDYMIKIALQLHDIEEARFFAVDVLVQLAFLKLKESGDNDVKLELKMLKDVKTVEQFNDIIKEQITHHAKIVQKIHSAKIQTLVAEVEELKADRARQDEEFRKLIEQFKALQLGTPAPSASAYRAAPPPRFDTAPYIEGDSSSRAYLNQAPGASKSPDSSRSSSSSHAGRMEAKEIKETKGKSTAKAQK